MTWGRGCPVSLSSKQKINSRSSTESELIVVNDCMDKVLWTRLFLKSQGIDIESTVVQQDNESAIRLENNGRWSAGKWSKVLNVRYYFISDQVE